MKIALANNLYFPYNRGGAEKVVSDIIADLKKTGHEVFLIATYPPHRPKPEPGDLKIYWLKSNYYNLGGKNFLNRVIWQISNLIAGRKYRLIKKILEQEKPDLLLTHNIMGLGFRLPKLVKRLKITHEHFLHDVQLLHPSGLMMVGQEKKIDSLPAKLYQNIIRHYFASPRRVISPSHWLLEQHRQRGFFPDSQLSIQPWSVNKQNTDANQRPPLNPNNQKNLLFVGQIEAHKGILFLIDAWKKLPDFYKSRGHLIIVGDGSQLKNIESLAQDEQSIEMRGRLEAGALTDTLKSSHYLIVPSLCYENSPTIITQAQELKLPIIASRLGGIPEMMGDSDILFSAGQTEELLKVLQDILKK
jgi:glycosyltransferase involved in cell wall biosynthesis